MNFARSGPRADWNNYAAALLDRADRMLRIEERRNPADGEVNATWTLPLGGGWGSVLVLDLEATGTGAEHSAFVALKTLADPAAALPLLHQIWSRLLDEECGCIVLASEPQLGRWGGDEQSGQ